MKRKYLIIIACIAMMGFLFVRFAHRQENYNIRIFGIRKYTDY